MSDLPTLPFASPAAWRAWLEQNHATAQGVWLQIAKKASGRATVTYAEAVDEALCFGWIDSHKRTYDETYFVQKFTPRRARSIWSGINVEKANALIEAGRMTEAGLREVERAKADGRWDAAYAPQSTIEPPADLLEALAQNPVAADNFAQLNAINRYAVLFRITTAKKPEARMRKIAELVAMLNAGRRIHE